MLMTNRTIYENFGWPFYLFVINFQKAQTNSTNLSSNQTQSTATTTLPPLSSFSITSTTSKSKIETNCKCNLEGGSCDNENICKCKAGYFGDFCEYIQCRNDTPQFNQCIHGKCLMYFNTTSNYKCKCELSYEGANCE